MSRTVNSVQLPTRRKDRLTVKNPRAAAAAAMDALFGCGFALGQAGTMTVVPGSACGRKKPFVYTRQEAEAAVLAVLERIELVEGCSK